MEDKEKKKGSLLGPEGITQANLERNLKYEAFTASI